jgi:hypothetical protein
MENTSTDLIDAQLENEMASKKDDKTRSCVFVSKQFAQFHPNYEMCYRISGGSDVIIFDCTSVVDIGNYLSIVAVDQSYYQEIYRNKSGTNIWIPTHFVLSVLHHPSDNARMGFVQSQQDDIDQDQSDLLP